MKKQPFYNKWAPIWTNNQWNSNICSRFRSDGALKGRWSPSGVNRLGELELVSILYKPVIVASSSVARETDFILVTIFCLC